MKLPPVAAKLLKKGAAAPKMGGVKRLSVVPRSWLYAGVSGLLVLGLVSSGLDVLARGDKERAYAKSSKQRLVFTGEQGEAGASAPVSEEGFEVDDDLSPEERKLRGADKKKPNTSPADTKESKSKTDIEPSEADAPDAGESKPEPQEAAEPAPESEVEKAAQEPKVEAPTVAVSVAEKTEGGLVLSDAKPPAVPNVARSESSLIFAPAREVSKETKAGSLPVIGDKGVRPFDVYHRTYRPQEGKAMLSIVITGMGFSAPSLNLALALPPEVSLSFSPYATDVAARIDAVRNGGHEVWFDVPVQTANYPAYDPGPMGLLTMLGVSDRDHRIEQMLIATRGAVGAIFPPEDVIKDTPPAFEGVVKKIQQHGLEAFYASVDAPKLAGKPMKRPTYSLLSTASPTKLASELAAITAKLNAETPVIIYVQGSPHVLTAIRDWLPSLKDAPVSLAPLSAFYMDYAAIAAEEEAAAENAGKEEKKGGH